MDDDAFDRALIAAGFAQAAELGWRHVTIPGAARAAGLPLARARARFPGRATLLLRFGRIADQSEIASVIVFLSSDGASYLTGETLVLDGGASHFLRFWQ